MNRMRYLIAVCALFACTSAPACADKGFVRDAQYAAGVATLTVETAQDGAVALYRAEQEAALAQALKDGVPKAEAEARVMVVRNRWKPVWAAFVKVRTAHAALVLALQAGNEGALLPALAALVAAQDELGRLLAQFRSVP